MGRPLPRAAVNFAAAACSSEKPRANPAVIPADRVQPVPWVDLVSIGGWRNGLPPAAARRPLDPAQEAVLADSVGLALLVILQKLTPAERVAFVLHDMFAIPFEEIGPIVGRSATAARQLASRARRRVQGPVAAQSADLAGHREVVDAFLSAIRRGDVAGLLAVLDPDVVLRADAAVPGGARELTGAEVIAGQAVRFGARAARPALVDGEVGLIVAPRGRLLLVVRFRIERGKIVQIEGVAEPARVAELDLAALGP